jgi:putative hydrolase of the HAD superfamily
MIKALLLDIDGVLIIGKPFSEHLEHDHNISRETTAAFFRERFPACLIGKADLRDELSNYLVGWGWQGSVDDFLRYWFTSEQTLNNQLVMALQLMRQQGVRCYLATNQEKYRSTYLWNKLGLNKKFDGLFSSSQIGYTKSSPHFYKYVLKELANVPPQEILFWDDQEENVEQARQVGLLAECYRNFSDFIQRTTHHIMPSQNASQRK